MRRIVAETISYGSIISGVVLTWVIAKNSIYRDENANWVVALLAAVLVLVVSPIMVVVVYGLVSPTENTDTEENEDEQ